MFTVPCLGPDAALFLDFDGTLAELAPRPDAVVVEPALPALLSALRDALGGALAIVSGRPIDEIDGFLTPLQLTAAGVHGAERRAPNGARWQMQPTGLDAVIAVGRRLCEQHPALLLEVKSAAVALHYRQAPDLETLCLEVMSDAAAGYDALTVLRGKRVVEVKPKRASKAEAVRTFLSEPPFAGRVPWFVGDDVTDEVAFEAVQTEGGMALKIGPGDTTALHRLDDPAAVHAWLKTCLDHLQAGANGTPASGTQGDASSVAAPAAPATAR